MSANLFCFKEALDARLNGEIALEECLRHVVAHYKGMIPTADAADKGPWIPEGFECEVRDLVLDKNYQPLTDDSKCNPNARLSVLGRTAYDTFQIRLLSIQSSRMDFKATSMPSGTFLDLPK
jgi:hypothetical protein